MNAETLSALPQDVKDGLELVIIDETIPSGMVEIRSSDRWARRVSADQFVAQRRALRKRARQNRKRGRKG